jgi:DNA gyrase subunit B
MMPPQNQQNSNLYDASKIIRLEPREHVRMRPGMYIGGTDKRALHNMVWEVLDDAISEFENTVYNEISISLLPDKTICVTDNGKGLPVDKTEHRQTKLEMYMTHIGMIHRNQFIYGESFRLAGLNGIGLLSINALSTHCWVTVYRDGFVWQQLYQEGHPVSDVHKIRALETGESTGTSISFRPDFSIMEENDFDFALISKRCQELAYLLPHLRITLEDKRETKQVISYHYPQGLVEWVDEVSKGKSSVIRPLNVFYDCELIDMQDKPYTVKIHLALQWLTDGKQVIRSYANTVETPHSGTHLIAFITALRKHLQIPSWQILKQGFVGIIHVLHPDPQFERQTRVRLLNLDAYTAVDRAVEALFAAHPEAQAAIQAHFNRS